jgi:predicted MFS family arabinose efflux permease
MGAAGTESLAVRKIGPPLLRDTVFRRYWSASTVSMVGDQVTTVAVPLTAVLALHAGAAVMSFLAGPSLGGLLGGLLGTAVGLRPALWVAVIGSVAGAALLVPSPLPRFRLPG